MRPINFRWMRFKQTVYSTILCIRYPFLKHYWMRHKLIQRTCWYYSFYDGWKKMALQMCEEIRDLEKCDKCKFRIYDIKTVDGYLTIDCGGSHDMHKVADKYEYISARTCIVCGRPAYCYLDGHASPYCRHCAPKGWKAYKYGTEEDKWYGTYYSGEPSDPIIIE